MNCGKFLLLRRMKRRAMKLRRNSGSGSEGAKWRQVNGLEGGRAVKRPQSDLGRTREWM